MPPVPYVLIFDPDATSGRWLLENLEQIHIAAHWVPSVQELLTVAEQRSPVVCLYTLRPPIPQALKRLTDLIQEPRFAHTAFIGVGALPNKHAAFEAGADDYLITPPDIIELRQCVRLHMDRAALEARLVAETRITQEMEALEEAATAETVTSAEALTLLEHVAELTRERDLYETILRTAGNPLAFIAPEGTAYYVNPAWQRYFGPAETLLDSPGWPPHTDNPEADRALQAAITQIAPWQGSASLLTLDSQWVEMYMLLSPVTTADRGLYGYTLVLMDVSAQQMPKTLRANLVAQAITELRSPLSNLKVRHYLLQAAPPDQSETHLQALGEGIEHLTRVLDRIAELFSLDGGLTNFTFRPLDLNQLVQGVAARYQAQSNARQMTFRVIPYGNLPHVVGDTPHLAHALGLLLECLMQHSPANAPITLEVGINRAAEHSFATVQIRNAEITTARDMSITAYLRSAWGTETSAASEPRIALTIAQEIVRLHKGMLTVTQEAADRYAMTVWLPLDVRKESAPPDTF